MTYVSSVVSVNMILLFVITIAIIGVVIGVYITLSAVNTLVLDLDALIVKIDNTATNAVSTIETSVVNGYNQILDQCIATNGN